jgi:hypothetical protein
VQNPDDDTNFKYVFFETSPVMPPSSGWTTSIETGYTSVTGCIVPETGYYLITYKADICYTGNGNQPVTVAAVCTSNGDEIAGSQTLIVRTGKDDIDTITATFMVALTQGEEVSLLFWTDSAADIQIGNPTQITGQLPGGGGTPFETTASLCITHVY